MEGFEDSVGGKWILLRNEGFDEYLAAMGIGYIKRKIACAVTTKMELLKVGDNRIRVITKGPKDMDNQINLDETVDEVDPFDNKIKVKVTWDPNLKIMKTESDPAEGSAAKKSLVERRVLDNGELLMEVSLPNENIVCKRFFKRDS